MCCVPEPGARRQRGVILIIALVYLGFFALFCAAFVESNTLQLRLASHLGAQLQARQAGLGRIEQVLALQQELAPPGPVGTRHCAPGSRVVGCSSHTLDADGVATAYLEVLTRGGEAPPRVREQLASSALAYRAMQYQVVAEARVDAAAVVMHQGVLVLYPGGEQ